MKRRLLLPLMLVLMASAFVSGQDFVDGTVSFSKKKNSYITLKDGTEITAYCDKLTRKKGLIKEVRIKMEDGSKRELMADEIRQMYLPPTEFETAMNTIDRATNVKRIELGQNDVNDGYIQEGYVLFESAEFIIKKKKMNVLAQLVNPGFAGTVRVYFDPWASESASVGVGPMTLAGGLAKSYYVRVGDKPAYLLKRNAYNDFAALQYKRCSSVKAMASNGKYDWADFPKHLYEYTAECTGK